MDGCLKLNTDGSSHGNLGLGGGGGILRDLNGEVVFAFVEYYGRLLHYRRRLGLFTRVLKFVLLMIFLV